MHQLFEISCRLLLCDRGNGASVGIEPRARDIKRSVGRFKVQLFGRREEGNHSFAFLEGLRLYNCDWRA